MVPEFSAVIALISTQTIQALLGTPLRSGHPYLIHHLQPYRSLSHIGRTHEKSQGQPITFSQQMDGASFALPAIGESSPLELTRYGGHLKAWDVKPWQEGSSHAKDQTTLSTRVSC
jgi:hypothetical protein